VSLGLLGFSSPLLQASEFSISKSQAINKTYASYQDVELRAGLSLWGEGLFATGVDDPVTVFIPIVMCNANSPPQLIEITDIFFDGVVPQSESDEYAEITNLGSRSVNLEDWRLNAGELGQDFTFPEYWITPGQSCRVYTNEIHPESCGFSFMSGVAFWNNEDDCGYLYNQSGAQVSSYCY
jgi:hypothetical protein